MTRSFSPWLLLMAVVPVGVGATYVACPGCVDRHRGNRACEWVGDSPFPMDMRNREHREHLVADAQLAEELAIRFADTEYARRFGGQPAHGGLLESGRVRNQCMDRLVVEIESNHTVTAEQVEFARTGRNPLFDSIVVLLFVPTYLFFASLACARIGNLLLSESRIVKLPVVGLASGLVSFLGLLFFQLWSAVMEGMRVGNPDGHMSSYRAARQPYWTSGSVSALFVGGMLLFWFLAAFYRPGSRNKSSWASSATFGRGRATETSEDSAH
jgi:hypothetical protein